jgi:hypothetical protein
MESNANFKTTYNEHVEIKRKMKKKSSLPPSNSKENKIEPLL